MENNKPIGFHTPEKTEEYLNALNNKTKIKWEDSSWTHDLADSCWNGGLNISVFFPNEKEDFSWFTIQNHTTLIDTDFNSIEEVITHLNKLVS